MPLRGIVIVLIAALALSACAGDDLLELEYDASMATGAVVERSADVTSSADGFLYVTNATRPNAYILDSGDRLRVDVFGQSNLSRIYNVDGGGFISLPLIGAVRARGQTTFSLARNISSRLSQGYLRNPKVTVEVSSYRPFFILGEVRNPGRFSYENGMTVRTAVAIAGGYTPRAYEGTANVTRKINGQTVTIEVPFNHPVQPGDTVYVTERFL